MNLLWLCLVIAVCSNQGFKGFRTDKLAEHKTIKNAGGCAQSCSETPGCRYWLVHGQHGCVLNTAKKGTLSDGKKECVFLFCLF